MDALMGKKSRQSRKLSLWPRWPILASKQTACVFFFFFSVVSTGFPPPLYALHCVSSFGIWFLNKILDGKWEPISLSNSLIIGFKMRYYWFCMFELHKSDETAVSRLMQQFFDYVKKSFAMSVASWCFWSTKQPVGHSFGNRTDIFDSRKRTCS